MPSPSPAPQHCRLPEILSANGSVPLQAGILKPSIYFGDFWYRAIHGLYALSQVDPLEWQSQQMSLAEAYGGKLLFADENPVVEAVT